MEKCPKCGLNPNPNQSKEQQEWERDYIKENKVCSACKEETKEN